MADEIVGQPLTEITYFLCPSCQKGPVKSTLTKVPYPCPFCGTMMAYLRTEWEERGTHILAPLPEKIGGV
jgi:predicted RNA-binding Zn-ribbon protein involved in translation (DUF1610 family)